MPTSARTSRAWGGGTPGPSLTTHTTLSPSRESRGAGEAGERAAGTASATAGCPGSAHDHSCVPSRAVRVSSKRPDVARETGVAPAALAIGGSGSTVQPIRRARSPPESIAHTGPGTPPLKSTRSGIRHSIGHAICSTAVSGSMRKRVGIATR